MASCPVPRAVEETVRADTAMTVEEEEEEEEESQVHQGQEAKVAEQPEPDQGIVMELDPACPAHPHPHPHPETSDTVEDEEGEQGEKTPDDSNSVELVCLSPSSPPSPCPSLCTAIAPSFKPPVPSYWSLELLIAAAFCTDVPPFPMLPCSAPPACGSQPSYPSHRGMELLSELADLELQQHRRTTGDSQGEELLIFDLHSLATLAAARALELDSQEGSGASTGQHSPARRTLNLRRKCSWTPRHEPVCPAKGAMETMEGPELAMRVKLAELQRRYKEKQRELAKLQRKHDHQKEETPRSPARRGPGRPRKRKSAPATGPVSSSEAQRKVKSIGAGLGLLPEDLGGGGDTQRRKKKLSNRGFERLSAAQIKAQGCRKSGLHGVLSSKLARDVAQLKQKAQGKRTLTGAGPREKEASASSSNPKHGHRGQTAPKSECRRESGGQSDTAASADSGGAQESWAGPALMMRRGRRKGSGALTQGSARLQQPRVRVLRARRQEVLEEGETTPAESDSSDQEEEEEEGSYDSDEGQDIKAQPSRDISSSLAVTGPSPSSIVKLEANQKARNKKERQELYGSQSLSGAEGDVKVRKKTPYRLGLGTAAKKHQQDQELEGVRRARGPRPQEPRWGSLGTRGSFYRRSMGLVTFPTTSERLKRATRKSTMLRTPINKRRSCWSGGVQSPQSEENHCRGRRSRNKQPKGRAVSRLLESFAADEGFQMDEDTSFSEGDEDSNPSYNPKSPLAPNCVLTKELLIDGLKVLIAKEDELLYAARVHTLDLPDIYSIVIDGERGNRPRIYSLEQLLQEAVLDVRPETEAMLTEGTRVCAYWSERSRCLYPGNVHRGGSADEGKPGSVMVEFDDGDRGRISIPNIRLLPQGYQIHSGAEGSPALLVASGRAARRNSSLEQAPLIERPSERQANTDTNQSQEKPVHRRPGRPKGSGKKKQCDSAKQNPPPLLSWPAVAMPRKRASDNLFQLNGTPRKTLRGREGDFFPLTPGPTLLSAPSKGLFSSSSFEVDSFSSIANGYSTFGSQPSGTPLGHRSSSGAYGQRRRQDEVGMLQSRKNGPEFLVKLDHEGVTSPKTKSSKALLLLGGSGFGSKGVGGLTRPEAYSHPVLLVKDNRKGGASRAELLLKGAPPQRKPSPSLAIGEYGELGLSCHRDCHSSYSDLDDEEEEEEEERRRAALAAASGGMRTAGSFLSRLSVSSSSSGSSSSSSSGSLSSSSLSSSDNDSSYSSEDEESSTLLLQSCLSSHRPRSLLQPPEPPTTGPHQHSFVAKAVAVSNAKGGPTDHPGNSKPLKRKECSISPSKTHKELVKRQRLLPDDGTRPKMSSSFLSGRQLWRWSGNPTQRRGLKGKARKLFYKAIVRGRDTVHVGDCAVFLSAGRPHLPYVGRIESLWESWNSSMVVKVKWFYHPEETKLGKRHRDGKHALYQSCHEDENDVQTISHKCQVVSREEYERLNRGGQRPNNGPIQDLYYLAGTYDPTSGQLVTVEGVSILC